MKSPYSLHIKHSGLAHTMKEASDKSGRASFHPSSDELQFFGADGGWRFSLGRCFVCAVCTAFKYLHATFFSFCYLFPTLMFNRIDCN